MTISPRRCAAALLLAILWTCPAALAQAAPENPPPWWGLNDQNTVSLAWDFNNGAAPEVPTVQIVPGWYVPANTFFTRSLGVAWLPGLTNHVGVLGVANSGTTTRTETLSVQIDNNPQPNWIKIFWFQFDAFAADPSSVAAKVREALQPFVYKRADVAEDIDALGNGWSRFTFEANLIPQPDQEWIDWTMVAAATSTVAIDNLFVNSRCVMPGGDEDGEALGFGVPGTPNINTATTVNAIDTDGCAFALVGGAQRIFVSGSNANGSGIFRFDAATGTVAAPIALLPAGITNLGDLAVEDVPGAGPVIYGIGRGPANQHVLVPFDPTPGGGTFRPVTTVQIPPAVVLGGLTFFPHGRTGAGTFLVADITPTAPAPRQLFEIGRNGALLRTIQVPIEGIRGLGYDEIRGMLYALSERQDNRGIRVVGHEISAYSFQPTGNLFYGDLSRPGTVSPGGLARGLECFRVANAAGNRSTLRILCSVQSGLSGTPGFVYQLHGPFRYGFSLLGRAGMAGGLPHVGNGGWRVELRGLPRATFGILMLGFNNQVDVGTGLPLPFCLDRPPANLTSHAESCVSVSLDTQVGFFPFLGGMVSAPVGIPNSTVLQGTRTYWQWMVIDPGAPDSWSLSQAGKTILY
jgi:hypothetical protein